MNKKILTSITLAILLLGITFVYASMSISNEVSNARAYNVEISVTKGWNLISSGLTFTSDLSYLDESGDIKKGDIKAIYVYSNKINEYLSNYPHYDSRLYSPQEYFNGDEQDIIGQANLIYIDKSGTLKYQTKGIKKIDSINLFAGWNFLSITSEMLGRNLEEIKGNCNIEKSYLWWDKGQKWDNVPLDGPFPEELIGKGIIIKVVDNCSFGNNITEISPIPQLP